MKLLSTFFVVAILFFAIHTNAQQTSESDKKSGSHFSTSGGRAFWMGANYRQEWNTPIKAPYFKLSQEMGGLTPVKRGGGKQTKSLRVEDTKGRQYTLRSIQKFITSKTLPGDLQSEAAADLVSDGVSASYPYAALSVTVLAEAAGLPHGNPKIVIIADDPALGEYREDFAGMLAMFEERLPDSVDKAYDTDEVADKLEKDNDNRVDQLALLRVRILDMFVMDLDRHEGQWTWGAYDNPHGKGQTYFPIAKDRDQAFYTNQGVLPGIVKMRSLVPQLEGFKAQAKNINRFNFAARNLDRFFLTDLTEPEWRQTAEQFVSLMTDAVIDRAMAAQPEEIRKISAAKIAQTLKERRKYLVDEVIAYYRFISETVTINGSDKKELFEITHFDDGSAIVKINKIDKDGNVDILMYERKFDPLVTKDLIIFGMDGDDKFVTNGSNDKIKVRLIGGGGQDLFQNTAKNQNATIIYDRLGKGNTVDGRFKNKMSNDSAVNKFERLSFKYPYQSFFATVGYNPDDGVFLGPTFKYIRHGFRKEPYKSFHQVKTSFAFSTKAFNFEYFGEFPSSLGRNTDLVFDLAYRGPNNTTNFFGYGVNTVYDKSNPGKFRFYRVRYDLGDLNIMLRQRFSDKVSLLFGPSFQFYSLDATDKFNAVRNIVLNTVAIGLDPARVYKKQSYLGAKASLIVDTRDNKVVPQKGINWVTTFHRTIGMNDNSYDKINMLNSDFTFYLSVVKDWIVFANRTGAGTTSGDNGYEFFQAQYLGNESNLRGYRKERFAGKSKMYNQSELRIKVANLRTYLFPASLGVFAFFDAGRVWVENDTDNKVLSGYGGGIWFSPLRRIVLAVSYAKSKEDGIPMFSMGWKF